MTRTETILETDVDDCEVTGDINGLTIAFAEYETTVKVDRQTLRDRDLIDEDDADEYCDHDLDAAYDRGYEQGRSEFANGAAKVMEEWHNEHHAGVVRFCYDEPCKSLRTEAGP